MKTYKKKLINIVIVLAILAGLGVFLTASQGEKVSVGAAVTYSPDIFPLSDSTYDLGTTSLSWKSGSFDELCLTGDSCQTSWPIGSGGGASSTIITTNDGSQLNVGVPTLDFDTTYLSVTESPADEFNISIDNVTGLTGADADDLSDNDTDDLAEGATNLYYTLARLQTALTGGYDAVFGLSTTTNATSTNQAITNLLTFDGVTGSQWSDFCVSITGGSGLCDGTDNTGGGAGLATSTPIADTQIIFGTSASDVGAESAFTYNDATDLLTVINASTTDLTVTGNLWADLIGNANTATALFANGANCASGSAPLGVDASGAVENCFDVWTEAENTAAGYISNLSGFDTGDLTEGSNLYWTDTRFDNRLAATTSLPNLNITESQISDLQSYLTGVAWGDITGTLSNQTDLQTALNGKTDTSSTTLGVVTSIPNLSITESQISDLGSYLTGNQTITLSGDITGSGATAITTAIGSGVIVNGDVNASAAIDYSKLNLAGSIAETDLNANAPTDGYALVASSTAAGGFAWNSVSGSGDVTAASAFGTDNVLIRSDGTGKGVQSSGITIDDSDTVDFGGGLTLGADGFGYNELIFQEDGGGSPYLIFSPNVGTDSTLSASSDGVLLSGSLFVSGPIKLDSTPGSDHSAGGNITNTIKASTTVSIGQLVHLNSVGAWELADASATSTSQGMLGISIEDETNGDNMETALNGSFVRDDTWTWTTGLPLYISETAGAITHTPPSTSGAVVRRIGYATSDDEIYLDIGEVITLQ